MKVVILAGGQSTRLPNKLMLQTRSGQPLIASSLAIADSLASTSDQVVVVPSAPAPVTYWLKQQGRKVTHQPPDAKSLIDVLEALNLAGQDAVILFGDNYYRLDKINIELNSARVAHSSNNQLDGYCEHSSQWVTREHKPSVKFIGWLRSDQWDRLKYCCSIIEFMNDAKIDPHFAGGVVSDLGTPETYLNHWRLIDG